MAKFEALIESEIPHLRRYARALTGSAMAGDDLVQDTLERAWVKFHLWRSDSALRPWLFAVMHNLFVNQVRGRQKEVPETLGREALAVSAPGNQTEGLEVRDLEACLQQLSPEHRAVLLLISLEDLSYHEASRVLDVPVGTVMSRLSRARVRLAELMSEAAVPKGLKVVR